MIYLRKVWTSETLGSRKISKGIYLWLSIYVLIAYVLISKLSNYGLNAELNPDFFYKEKLKT
jgi:hypothetical protein